MKPFVEKMGAQMDYTVALDVDQTASSTLMRHFGARGIPTAFLIDATGKVKWFVAF